MSRTFGGVSTDSVATNLTAHNTQRSYSMWVYRTGGGGGNLGRMFDKRTGADAQVEVFYFDSVNSRYEYERDWTAAGQWYCTSPSANAWHHVVVTYDGSSSANKPLIYLDGTSQTITTGATPSGSLTTNTSGYVIGNRTNDNARNWAGNLCEFAVWNTILGQSDVTSLNGGTLPLLVQSGSLVGYWPLRCGNSPEPDLAGGTTAATVTGTVYAPTIDPSIPLPCPQQNVAYRTQVTDQAVPRAALL